MKACLYALRHQLIPIRSIYRSSSTRAGPGEVLVCVNFCGVCRTDLHVVEGELPPRKPHVIPGHQVVGLIEKLGTWRDSVPSGARVGIPLAAQHRSVLRILPRRQRKPLRSSDVHRLHR